MRSFLTTISRTGLCLSLVALASSASAITCSERLQVCFAFCEKSEGASPRCNAVCHQIHGECLQTGCWESRITARRCGITRR